jgi:hypothetical protein
MPMLITSFLWLKPILSKTSKSCRRFSLLPFFPHLRSFKPQKGLGIPRNTGFSLILLRPPASLEAGNSRPFSSAVDSEKDVQHIKSGGTGNGYFFAQNGYFFAQTRQPACQNLPHELFSQDVV